MTERTITRGHVLSPFGVGAIWNFRKESFVGVDTGKWRNPPTTIILQRLQDRLGVTKFLAPPVKRGQAPSPFPMPYHRFPEWLFCKACRNMVKWSTSMERPGEEPRCNRCTRRPVLVPMRFVVICSAGHMYDVPWEEWIHRGKGAGGNCDSRDLSFFTVPDAGPGLNSLFVKCNRCGVRKSVQKLYEEGPGDCQGRQPWQTQIARCDQTAVVVQRGAGDVYFAVCESAIDIPPHSNWDVYNSTFEKIVNHQLFSIIRGCPTAPFAQALIDQLARETETTPDAVRRTIDREVATIAGRPSPSGSDDILGDEYTALLEVRTVHDPRDRFITEHIEVPRNSEDPVVREIFGRISQVVSAKRLRVVKALKGFERAGRSEMVRPDLGQGLDWLPAVETYGEGIFVCLDEQELAEWEIGPKVVERVKILQARRDALTLGRHLPTVLTPRFVLLHTLSHLLIRQFAFDAGYNSASLTERIYAESGDSGPMAGILVYTADGDSEGTLGGLTRIASPSRLVPALLGSLQRAQWCSSDPICSESAGQGTNGSNLAACYACALVAETSCAHMNMALDRVLLIGNDDCPGFFQDVISIAEKTTTIE